MSLNVGFIKGSMLSPYFFMIDFSVKHLDRNMNVNVVCVSNVLLPVMMCCLPFLCRLSLAEQTESSHPAPASPSPPSDDPCTTHFPAIPPHLHKTTESPPHPSLESDTLPSTPPASPCFPTPVPADQCTLSTDNCEDLYPVSAPSQVLLRYGQKTSLSLPVRI